MSLDNFKVCNILNSTQIVLNIVVVQGSKHYHLSSNVNKPPYVTMFGARFYCALTLHVSAPIGGHLQVLCDKIYSKVATFMSTDPLSRRI
jgi:hypothetical protein